MERYAPTAKDLASRDVVSRAMTMEINDRGVGRKTIFCFIWNILMPTPCMNACQALPRQPAFSAVDVTREPIPVLPTVRTIWAVFRPIIMAKCSPTAVTRTGWRQA